MALKEKLIRAKEVATFAHEGQLRDEGVPYIVHPANVVDILKQIGCIEDPAVLAVGWLHDVVEDTHYTLEYVRKTFGKEIAFGVWLMTDNPDVSQRDRKADTINRLRHYYHNKFAVVKLADRLSNLSSMVTWNAKRKYKYAIGSLGILWAISKTSCPQLWDALFITVCSMVMPELEQDMFRNRKCCGCAKHRKTWWTGGHHYCMWCMKKRSVVKHK